MISVVFTQEPSKSGGDGDGDVELERDNVIIDDEFKPVSENEEDSREGSRGIGGNEVGEPCNTDSDCLGRLACERYECVDPCSPNLCIYQRKSLYIVLDYHFKKLKKLYQKCVSYVYLI